MAITKFAAYYFTMHIHKEGTGTIVISAVITAVVILVSVFFIMPRYETLGWIVAIGIVGLLIFILSFLEFLQELTPKEMKKLWPPAMVRWW